MDTSTIPAVASAQARVDSGLSVLKKANEVESQSALQLVEASTAGLPSYMGRNINTLA